MKLKTIKLQGREYVQVNTRVQYFNETYKNGSILTEPNFNQDAKTIIFKATVFPDAKNQERFFVGHSFGILGKEKAVEKLETVAVGRALALMGIGVVEGIASADEMERFNKREKIEETNSLEIPPVCSVCGKTGMKAKTKQGRVFWTCPAWKDHKEEGRKFDMIQPKEKLDPNMQSFSDSLDQIK